MGLPDLPSGCGASPAGVLSGVPVQPARPAACAKRNIAAHTIGTSSPSVPTKFHRSPISSRISTPPPHRDSTTCSPERQRAFRNSASMTQLDRPIADEYVFPSPVTCGRIGSKVSLVTTFADICENQKRADRAPWAQDVNSTHVLNSTQANNLVSTNSDASMLMVVRSMSSPSTRQVAGVDNSPETQVQNPDEATCIRALVAAMKQLKLDQESQLDIAKRQMENKFSELKETLDENVQLATTTASVVGDLSDRLAVLSNDRHNRSEKSDVHSILGMVHQMLREVTRLSEDLAADNACHNRSEKFDVHSILGVVHQTQREVTRLSEELAADRILRLGRSQIEVPPEMTDMMQRAPLNKATQNEEPRSSDYQCNGETIPTSQSEYLFTSQVAAHTHATGLNNDQIRDVFKDVIDKIRSTNSVCRSIPSGTRQPETTCVSDMCTNGRCESSGDPSDIDNPIQQSIQRVLRAFSKANGLENRDSLEQQNPQNSQQRQRLLLQEQQWLQQQLQSNEVQSTHPAHDLLAQPQVQQQQRCKASRGKSTCETIPEEPGDEALPELSSVNEC